MIDSMMDNNYRSQILVGGTICNFGWKIIFSKLLFSKYEQKPSADSNSWYAFTISMLSPLNYDDHGQSNQLIQTIKLNV